jgi:acetaldehyde dehydrogenase
VEEVVKEKITASVLRMVKDVQEFIPGYRLKIPPSFDGNKIIVMVEVEGSGDYLPTYSGNLDIETCAALAVGEKIAARRLRLAASRVEGVRS